MVDKSSIFLECVLNLLLEFLVVLFYFIYYLFVFLLILFELLVLLLLRALDVRSQLLHVFLKLLAFLLQTSYLVVLGK